MNSDNELAHKIKMKFGTAPNEPTQYQLDNIKRDIQILVNQGSTPSIEDWGRIVKRHCPQAGSYFYKGVDNSDLSTLLMLATRK